jgi:hypothetical protein
MTYYPCQLPYVRISYEPKINVTQWGFIANIEKTLAAIHPLLSHQVYKPYHKFLHGGKVSKEIFKPVIERTPEVIEAEDIDIIIFCAPRMSDLFPTIYEALKPLASTKEPLPLLHSIFLHKIFYFAHEAKLTLQLFDVISNTPFDICLCANEYAFFNAAFFSTALLLGELQLNKENKLYIRLPHNISLYPELLTERQLSKGASFSLHETVELKELKAMNILGYIYYFPIQVPFNPYAFSLEPHQADRLHKIYNTFFTKPQQVALLKPPSPASSTHSSNNDSGQFSPAPSTVSYTPPPSPASFRSLSPAPFPPNKPVSPLPTPILPSISFAPPKAAPPKWGSGKLKL